MKTSLEQITARIAKLRQRDAMFKAKYGMDYLSFTEKIASDKAFIREIEKNVTKMWEIDLAEWEFCYKGIDDWSDRLKKTESESC